MSNLTNAFANISAQFAELAKDALVQMSEARGTTGLEKIAEVKSEVCEAAAVVTGELEEAQIFLNNAAEAHKVQVEEFIQAVDIQVTRIHADIKTSALQQVMELLKGGAITVADLAQHLNFPVLAVAETTVAAPVVTVTPTQRLTAPYKTAIKFYDPASGAGWSGRGQTPKWLTDLCVEGKTKEDFRVIPKTDVSTATDPAPSVTLAGEMTSTTEANNADATEPEVNPLTTDFDDISAPAQNLHDIGDDLDENQTGSFNIDDFNVQSNTGVIPQNPEDEVNQIVAGFGTLTEISLNEATY